MNENKTALVVDDDEDICTSIQERIQDYFGHQCDTANSICQAKSLMQKNHYDYIILDMELPYQYGRLPDVGVGITFLGQLRERYSSEELPIIVVTGRVPTHESLPSDAIYEGATDFLTKPLHMDGDHTLESSIMKFVTHNKTPMKNDTKWLFREPDGNMLIWKSVAKDGNVRTYPVNPSDLRCAVLDCIYMNMTTEAVVKHKDLIRASRGRWTETSYYPNNCIASKGPIRSHIKVLRERLGLDISYTSDGIMVCQPIK